MAFTLGKFSFDKATVISIVVVIALLGIGYGIGALAGEKKVEDRIIELGGAQQSLSGEVKSTSKDGFVLKVEGSDALGGAIGGSTGGDTKGDWTVKYGKNGASISGGLSGPGAEGGQELKKGDKVQVSGIAIGEKTVIAQSISKIVPPTPAPSGSPSAGASNLQAPAALQQGPRP